MVPELSTVTPAATVTLELSPEISNCVQLVEIVTVPDASAQLAAYPCAELKYKHSRRIILFLNVHVILEALKRLTFRVMSHLTH
ncbi:MAG: hypothetical protein HOM64_02670 [Proteobacteria bacterium]|nr:hypothetical protein [Pseudomonadota bacterium]